MEEVIDVVEEPTPDSSTAENGSQETTDTRTDAEKGLIDEIQGMREEIKSLKDTSYRSQQEIDFLRNSQVEQEDSNYDPDDFVTGDDVDAMIQKKLEPQAQQLRMNELNMLEAQMSAKYPDYEEVVGVYGKALFDGNPDLQKAVMSSANPAETAYLLSKSHPEYLKLQELQARKDTANKIQGNLDSTPTVAGSGGSAVSGSIDWNTASDKALESKLRELGVS